MSKPAPGPARKGNRREFVRTEIRLTERIASGVILTLIGVAGWAVHYSGQHYDPSRYAVRTEALESTAQAVVGKSGTAPSTPSVSPSETAVSPTPSQAAPAAASGAAPESATDSGDNSATATAPPSAPAASSDAGGAEGGGAAASTAPALPKIPLEIGLPGIQPMGDTEFYDSDSLYEKIDGRSPAYQSFNVVQLRCRSFSVLAAAGSFVDVYEYKFDNPVDAFGMFALERDPKGKPLDFAPDGYSGELGYFFRQGPVYVQINASDTKPATLAATLAIAKNRASELPADDHGLAGRKRLPAEGMEPDSVAYVLENAQGQSALKDVFQAKYKFNGQELPFFVMVAAPADAAAAWQSFQDFCKRFGKVEVLAEVAGGKIFRAQVFGKWKVVYQREGELGGVFDANDGNQARAFVEKYLQGEIK